MPGELARLITESARFQSLHLSPFAAVLTVEPAADPVAFVGGGGGGRIEGFRTICLKVWTFGDITGQHSGSKSLNLKPSRTRFSTGNLNGRSFTKLRAVCCPPGLRLSEQQVLSNIIDSENIYDLSGGYAYLLVHKMKHANNATLHTTHKKACHTSGMGRNGISYFSLRRFVVFSSLQSNNAGIIHLGQT